MSIYAPGATEVEHAPLGEILIERGIIDVQQLDEALAHQRELGLKLGQALVGLKFCTELELAEALGAQGRIPAIELHREIVDQEVVRDLGAETSWRLSSIAINRIAGVTTVAMEDPSDTSVIDEIGRRLGTPVFPVHAGPGMIESCLDHFFPKGFEAPSTLDDVVAGCDPVRMGLSQKTAGDLERFDDGKGEQPVIRLLRGIIEDACKSRASDIHLEPRRHSFVVRYRVDGSLRERCCLPKSWLRPCLSRLKIMADLDIMQRRLPQDGRILFDVEGRRVDLRIATSNTLEGEGAALRVFDGGRQIMGLDQLGFDPDQLANMRTAFGARDGFILATGPSGSGKTTTLYGMLRELNSEERKIVTLEDPVESEIEEAFQIGANPRIGLGFEEGLRAVLRLDPDIIMIGEIRDAKTARTAVTASLTGHLVLSSLATVGTAETIIRLQDLGVDRHLLADTLRAVISQRLVRRICRSCRTQVQPADRLLQSMGLQLSDGPFFHGTGCDECANTGFRGRLALCEILAMSPDIYDYVSQRKSSGELYAAARDAGMRTLREDGLQKVLAGQTTLEEVLAVTMSRSIR
ncbi:MAG: ATPase, T2SS/T4P/T4SS family [Planctomycetota bacterium]